MKPEQLKRKGEEAEEEETQGQPAKEGRKKNN